MSSVSVAHRQLEHEPAPAWAETPPFERPSGPWISETEGGARYWLVDDQVRIGAGPTQSLVRRTTEVINPDGLNGVASVEILFDPTCERAVVHFVRVIRGDQVRELPTAEAFEVFRRERDLERAMLDGRLTAHMVISDLRVGDIVDYCFSIIGENPAHRGLFGSWPRFQWGVHVDRVRFRLLAPPERSFAVRYWGEPSAYEKRDHDGLSEHVWSAENVPGFHYEQGTPPEWLGHRCVLIAEAVDWAQVADLFRGPYAPPPRLPESLTALADKIAEAYANPADRLAAALRLVQSEIRYLALSFGEGGFVPRSVDEIWASRFGDCKDSSRLLVALLTALEVEASPALVNTRFGYDMAEWPASSIVFDHCIVRAVADGAVWWLDPTRSPQSGRLERITQARFGWALPLVADARLEFSGVEPVQPITDVRHEIWFGAGARTPARLEVRATCRRWRADSIRQRLAVEGLQALARSHREFYENRYGRLEVVEPLKIVDRPEDNELDTIEVFELLEPWQPSDDGKQFYFASGDELMGGEFAVARTPDRRSPIELGWPRRTTQEVVMHLPRVWNLSEYDERWTAGPIEIAARFKSEEKGRLARLNVEVEVKDRVLEPKDAKAYFEVGERAHHHAGVTLNHPAVAGEFTAAEEPQWFHAPWVRWAWGALIVCLILARIYEANRG